MRILTKILSLKTKRNRESLLQKHNCFYVCKRQVQPIDQGNRKNINNDATQKAIPSQILLRDGVKNL